MKKFMILAGVVTVLLFSILIYIVMGEDRSAPVITQDNTNLTYKEGADNKGLLSGVKAKDDVDGDVTASVIVGDVVTMPDKTAAKVTYLAKDSSNNVGELEIIVPCEGKVQEADGTTVQAVNSNNGKKKEPEENRQESTQAGNTQAGNTGKPVIALTAKEADIKVRGEFHPEDYIKDIKDDKDSLITLLKNITVTGNYDRNKPGTYVLLIAAKDSDGNMSDGASFVLNVKP